ncbi:hypothetical protein KIL84_007544 [Mauremys mutica]|uniref:Uncharacterized protein n=1 Tax=Mauremys mutica TaxID=74926 RepID=A0A9D3X309_9SAUR|nr:hypothetical protein KIL84_007544 [Mauremys mutica]
MGQRKIRWIPAGPKLSLSTSPSAVQLGNPKRFMGELRQQRGCFLPPEPRAGEQVVRRDPELPCWAKIRHAPSQRLSEESANGAIPLAGCSSAPLADSWRVIAARVALGWQRKVGQVHWCQLIGSYCRSIHAASSQLRQGRGARLLVF